MSPPIADSPSSGRVYWTAFTDLEGDSGPTDPLRFDMYTQRIGNILLPGITNRTERLRYISMVCAGLATTGDRATTVRDRRRAFLPFERGWALAMTLSVDGRLKLGVADGAGQRGLRPEFRGFRGANRVLAHFRTLRDRPRVRPTAYTLLQGQDAQGGLGAYLVTLRQFGFVHPDSLSLTSLGREMAASFVPQFRGGKLSVLADEAPVSRALLSRFGQALALGNPTIEERELVRNAIFGPDQSVVGEVVLRMRTASPKAKDPRELMASIARSDGDQLGRAAAYALAFDPLRIASLKLFARLGDQLRPRRGSCRLDELHPEPLETAAKQVRDSAPAVADMRDLDGLAPISKLARDLSATRALDETVSAIVSFHRREERSWIVAEGPQRYRLGRHGRFEEPSDTFNGYTVGRAFQLLADVEGAS